MSALLAELKRRNVFRMAGLYLVTSWLLIQIAETLLPIFDTPTWVLKALVLLLALGFLPALVFSWIFELTPEGLKLDGGRTPDNPVTPVTARRMDRMLLIGMSLIVVLLIAERFWWPQAPSAQTAELQVTPPADPEAPSADGSGDEQHAVPAVETVPNETSIAVLPFLNMSPEPDNDYFADGLTETLLHMLAQIDGLQVTARTSSFAFKGQNIDVRDIGRQLGVGRLLEGSVQRAGKRVRITAQLVETVNGSHVWSRTFDRKLDDIFTVQDEISSEVAKTLSSSLQAQHPVASTGQLPVLRMRGQLPSRDNLIQLRGGTANALAYDLYLRAREAYWDGQEQSLTHGITLIREALALDPEFALAWSTLAELIVRHGRVAGISDASLDAQALDAVRKGAALAPAAPGIQAVLGRLTDVLADDSEEARAILQRALAINPDHPQLLGDLATLEWRAGEVKSALDLSRRAMLLDPLDLALKADSVHKFVAAGDAVTAEQLALSIIERDRESLDGLHALANVYFRTGQFAQAFDTYTTILGRTPNDNEIKWRLMVMLLNLGDFDGARDRLMQLVDTDPGMQWGPQHRWKAQICFLEGHPACAASIWDAAQAQAGGVADNNQRNYELEEALHRQAWSRLKDAALRQATAAESSGDGLNRPAALSLAALAAHRLDQQADVENLSFQALERLEILERQGLDNQYLHAMKARVQALRGDAASAMDSLRVAIAKGYRNTAQVRMEGFFELIINDQVLATMLDQLDHANAAELAAVRAVVADIR